MNRHQNLSTNVTQHSQQVHFLPLASTVVSTILGPKLHTLNTIFSRTWHQCGILFSSAHKNVNKGTEKHIYYKMGVYLIRQMFKTSLLRLRSCKITKRKYFQCLSLMNEEAMISSSYINLDQELCTPVCFKVFEQVIGTKIAKTSMYMQKIQYYRHAFTLLIMRLFLVSQHCVTIVGVKTKNS